MDKGERLTHLLAGLVADEHRQLYMTDIEFQSQIQTLARMLIIWTDAMAAEAQAHKAERDAAIRFLREGR